MNTTPRAGTRTKPTVQIVLTEDQTLMLARTLQRMGGKPTDELAELRAIVYAVADEVVIAQAVARRNARTQATLPGLDK